MGKNRTTLWRRLLDVGLVALESVSSGKGNYYGTLRCCTLPSKENQLHSFCDRFFSRPYSAALSFPPRSVTGTSGYRFEYDLHLIKIPSHLDRESIYREHIPIDNPVTLLSMIYLSTVVCIRNGAIQMYSVRETALQVNLPFKCDSLCNKL